METSGCPLVTGFSSWQKVAQRAKSERLREPRAVQRFIRSWYSSSDNRKLTTRVRRASSVINLKSPKGCFDSGGGRDSILDQRCLRLQPVFNCLPRAFRQPTSGACIFNDEAISVELRVPINVVP